MSRWLYSATHICNESLSNCICKLFDDSEVEEALKTGEWSKVPIRSAKNFSTSLEEKVGSDGLTASQRSEEKTRLEDYAKEKFGVDLNKNKSIKNLKKEIEELETEADEKEVLESLEEAGRIEENEALEELENEE